MENQYEPNLQQQESPQKPKKPWYKKWWIWVIGGVVVLAIIGAFIPKDASKKENQAAGTIATTAVVQTTVEPTKENTTEKATEAPTQKPTKAPTESPTEALPREYQNALDKAESYLSYSSFSKEGLYDQLLFEKFSEESSRYAVENVVTDWNENAVKKAESYLSYSSFSKDGLYEQLIFEKFTPDQAQYAVDKIY